MLLMWILFVAHVGMTLTSFYIYRRLSAVIAAGTKQMQYLTETFVRMTADGDVPPPPEVH